MVLCDRLFRWFCMDVLLLLPASDGFGASWDFCMRCLRFPYDCADLFVDQGNTTLRLPLRPDFFGTHSSLQTHCVPVGRVVCYEYGEYFLDIDAMEVIH